MALLVACLDLHTRRRPYYALRCTVLFFICRIIDDIGIKLLETGTMAVEEAIKLASLDQDYEVAVSHGALGLAVVVTMCMLCH
jgi:hypothetical protein